MTAKSGSTSTKTKLPGSKGSEDLSSRLKARLSKAFYADDVGRDRVKNRSIPYDPLEVFDFPADLEYEWVPAPGKTAPDVHNAADMAQKRAELIQRGWNYYPADEFGKRGETPWMVEWQNDEGYVRSMDCWLVYTDKDRQQRKRRENERQWNQRHEAKKQNERKEGQRGATVREYKREPLTQKELMADLTDRMEQAGELEDE